MAIKANIVTVTLAAAIDKTQRVTLVGASSVALTLPAYDDIDITQNTRFTVVIPAGLGITGTTIATVDGTLFDTNGLTSWAIPAEGQYEFCINNGRWYVLSYVVSGSGSGTVTNVGTAGLISGGPITTTGTVTTLMNTNRLVGRSTAGTGIMEEISLGSGLSLSGGTLSATGGGPTFLDSVFRIQDDVDATKQIAWEASGITTATTRTITMVNFSGTQVLSAGALTSTRIPYSTTAGLADTSALVWDSVNQQLELSNLGSVTQPSLVLGTSMGWYGVSATNMGLSISSVLRVQCDATSLRSGITGGFQLLQNPGSAAGPVYSFTNDTNTGIWSQAADTLNFPTGGTDRLTIDTTNLFGSANFGFSIRSAAGAAATPTYSFRGDTDTGFWSNSANSFKWSVGGTQVGHVDNAGKMFIGGATAPTARLHLAAGTATANTAPFKTTTGVLNTTPEAGAWEHTDPYIYFTNNFLVRNKITQSQQFSLGSSFTKTADTTQATITGFSASVVNGNIYRFEARLNIDADAVGGFDVGFGGTATASVFIAEYMYFDNVGAGAFSRRLTTLPGSFGGTAGSTQGFMMVQGFFRANATGTFEVQFAQQVASGSSSVVTGSTFEVYQG